MNIDNILGGNGSSVGIIVVNGEIQGFLKETAKWAKFVAIVGFAVNTQKALAANDQQFLSNAFKNMKSLFKFMGIFTAIGLGVYLLILIGAGLFGMVGGF